jgi:hypothetical protein
MTYTVQQLTKRNWTTPEVDADARHGARIAWQRSRNSISVLATAVSACASFACNSCAAAISSRCAFPVLVDFRIAVLEHQPVLVAEMPDRAMDQFGQGCRAIVGGFAGPHGAIEFIEDAHQLAVVIVDFLDADGEDLAPGDVFHDASHACGGLLPDRGRRLPALYRKTAPAED